MVRAYAISYKLRHLHRQGLYFLHSKSKESAVVDYYLVLVLIYMNF